MAISGEITADEVVVRGEVKGRIHAKTVQLASTAKMLGDISHDSLSIDAGAYLDGHCKRHDTANDKTATGSTQTAGTEGPGFLSPNAGKPAAAATTKAS